MIQQLSNNIGTNLATLLGYDKPQAEIFAYALQVLFETLIKVFLIIASAILLGIGKPTIVVFTVYGIIRSFGGGAHLSTFPRCFTVGWLLIIGLGLLSIKNIPDLWVGVIFFLTLIAGVVSNILWVPAGTEKKQIIDPEIRKRQKVKMFLIILLWTIVIGCLEFNGHDTYVRAVIYGAVGAIILISPIGYKLLAALDRRLDRIMKGGAYTNEEVC